MERDKYVEELEVETSGSFTWMEKVQEKLIKINSPFADKEFTYFKENNIERLQELSSWSKDNDNNIFQFLKILAKVEGEIVDVQTNYSNTRLSIINRFQSPFSSDEKYNTYFTKYYSSRLPHCCGITEYGEFAFGEFKIIDKNLVYNLVVDLIRITANDCRIKHSGALGIINYFVDTAFTKVLENRNDLTCIKQFKNPKSGATLKSFIFDTKI